MALKIRNWNSKEKCPELVLYEHTSEQKLVGEHSDSDIESVLSGECYKHVPHIRRPAEHKDPHHEGEEIWNTNNRKLDEKTRGTEQDWVPVFSLMWTLGKTSQLPPPKKKKTSRTGYLRLPIWENVFRGWTSETRLWITKETWWWQYHAVGLLSFSFKVLKPSIAC